MGKLTKAQRAMLDAAANEKTDGVMMHDGKMRPYVSNAPSRFREREMTTPNLPGIRAMSSTIGAWRKCNGGRNSVYPPNRDFGRRIRCSNYAASAVREPLVPKRHGGCGVPSVLCRTEGRECRPHPKSSGLYDSRRRSCASSPSTYPTDRRAARDGNHGLLQETPSAAKVDEET